MTYKFHAYGHPNILGTHKTTLEFTKDREVTKKGDCIIGVDSDFDFKELKKFDGKVKITIKTGKIKDFLFANINPNFRSREEIVVRMGDFASDRTFAIRSNKASFGIKREIIDYLRTERSKILVIIENID